VNETFARTFFPKGQALGQRIQIGDGGPNPCEIMGVIRDVKNFGLEEKAPSEMYFPYRQRCWGYLSMVVRTTAEPASMAGLLRDAVLAIDKDKRQIRLGMKQLVPTGLDEYIAEHKEGDVVTGRMMDGSGAKARAELGEGIHAACRIVAATPAKQKEEPRDQNKADLSSLSSMLQARWKSGGTVDKAKPEGARAGEIRQFRIVKLDAAAKKIELELA